MFDADRPILTSHEDRLGRTTFAKSLARSILDHKHPDSLVIGLYGGWGVGKTSIINLTLEELNYASSNMFDDERPIILNFSPWSYSGQQQLIYSFFRRLSSELRQCEYLENSQQIIHLLELYISFFTHQPVPKTLRPKHYFWTKIFKPHSIAGDTLGWESGRDLVQVKKSLNELLSRQKHKIIIMIDNIATLEAEEIKEIFQIVKSIGDFNNTIYVLALDKEPVAHALSQFLNHDGNAYLDKVIQMPFIIPSISPSDLEVILLEKLQVIAAEAPLDTWNKDYWGDLYFPTLRHLFKNMRDITHYINALGFSYIHVKEVVNPVDFFAITAIEVFAPAIYTGIRDNKDLFTDLMDDVYKLDSKKIAEDKLRCDEILSRNNIVPHAMLLNLLIQLFPRLRSLYEIPIPFYHSETVARKDYRICSPDMFDIYFRLSLPAGMMPTAEFEAVLAMIKDEEGFALALLRLNHDQRILQFLDKFDSIGVAQLSLQNVGHVINALIDSADMFPEGKATHVSFDTAMRVHRILHQLFRRFPTTEKRFELFRQAIKKSVNSIYIIVYELTEQAHEHTEEEDTFLPLEHRDFFPEQLMVLQRLAVSKIIYWADTYRLIDHPKLIPILYAWKDWGNAELCTKYIALVTQEDKGLLAFLCAALKTPIEQALTKYEKKPEWIEYLAEIENFIAPKELEQHAKLLFESDEFEKLREREQLALLIFLDLINAKTIKIMMPPTS
jgi:predicted KAP-like P-loop ATPase